MEDHLKAAADAAAMTNEALLEIIRDIDESKPLSCLEEAVRDEIRLRKLAID